MVASIWQPGGSSVVPTANGTGTSTERFTAIAGQTLITFTKFIYTLGVDALEVYVNGALQTLGTGYTESSNSTVTLLYPLIAGDEIVVVATLNITAFTPIAPITTLGGVSIANFVMNTSTVGAKVVYLNTNPAGWNTNIGRMTLDMTVTINGYFAANPNGHFVAVLRQDAATVNTAIKGQGVAIGLKYLPNATDVNPTSMLETWFNGTGAGNYLWPYTETARSIGLQDGKTYRFIVDSMKVNSGSRYLRYRCYRVEADGTFLSMVDSGDVLDHNTFVDLTQSALMFAHGFESNLSVWSLAFSNVSVTWGPAENTVPDQSLKLSRYGAQLEGDLQFVGSGRKIIAPAGVGPSLAGFLSYQTVTVNGSTSIVYKPNGTGTTANTLYSNNSDSSTTYQAATFGIAGALAIIETFGVGTSSPTLGINIGIATRVATFKPTGLNLLGGAKDIGVLIGWSAAITNWGGTNATSFASSTASIDMDALSTAGTIAGYLTATYDPNKVSDMVRPLWCMLSFLVKNLQDKKVI